MRWRETVVRRWRETVVRRWRERETVVRRWRERGVRRWRERDDRWKDKLTKECEKEREINMSFPVSLKLTIQGCNSRKAS